MIYDSHVHTKYSIDSETDMEDYVKAAEEKGISLLCFTDHVDFNQNDYGYKYYDPEGYFKEFNQIIERIEGDIEVFTGIEFSEPHLYYDKLEWLNEYPYDFILGSIHWVKDMFPCKEVRERYSADEFYYMYWQEIKKAVNTGGFDCLSHIDFPKRYYGKVIYELETLKDIFTSMIHKNIALEINTSSLRKGINFSMPDEELLYIYKECGGRYVTIGSDAHSIHELGADYKYAEGLVKNLGLKKVFFKKRKLVLIEDI